MLKMVRVLAAVFVSMLAVVLVQSSAVPAAQAAATPPTDGTYYATKLTRVADTRTGLGVARHRIRAGETLLVPVLGRGGVPTTGVSAVAINITIVNPDRSGWLTAYGAGGKVPHIASASFGAGWTGAIAPTVDLGPDGRIALLTPVASLDLVVDVLGYYGSTTTTGAAGADYVPARPNWRAADTRATRRLAPGASVNVGFGYTSTEPTSVTAVRVNITALNANGPGWLTAWSGVGSAPTGSVVNVARGEVSPNSVLVPVRRVSTGGYAFTIKNTGPVPMDVLVDMQGYYTLRFTGPWTVRKPFDPTRWVDTRIGLGASTLVPRRSTVVRAPAPHQADSFAFEATIGGVSPRGATWVAAYSNGPTTPATSNLNLTVSNRSNAAAPSYFTGPDGINRFLLYTSSAATDVTVDVTAVFVPVSR